MDVLAANVITAAEQQTMNYYMNTAALWPDEMGRRLYQEIGMVEEQHVTQYGSMSSAGCIGAAMKRRRIQEYVAYGSLCLNRSLSICILHLSC